MIEDLRQAVAVELLKSVVGAYKSNGADVSKLIDPDIVTDAMVMALATVLEADPRIRTSKDVEERVKRIGKGVADYAARLRTTYEQTGKRVWDAQQLTRQ